MANSSEFHFVVYLIFSRMGHLSVESLARNIGMMRSRIRDRHLDIRANGRVMSDLHSIIQTIPRRTNPGEVAAAEEYEGDEVDPRDVRAAKRSRRAEAEDPTYHGDVVPRDIQASDAVNNTRSKTSKTSSTSRPAITRPPVPSVITAPRPGANTMDALPTPHTGNGYGQYPGQVNPYSSAYQAAGQGGVSRQILSSGFGADQTAAATSIRPDPAEPESVCSARAATTTIPKFFRSLNSQTTSAR